jgi:DNA-binding winged helix-turn-helix (wHTH) protein/class 3 adenylate cyclase/tetratricopeptide (TPR) repeat protein
VSNQRKVLKVLGFTIDPARCALRAADHDIKLRPKSFDVLHHLVQNAGRLVRREELIDTVWPGVIVTEESVTQCVSEVRQALRDQEHKIIKTVARRGYLFAAPVEQIICHDAPYVHQAPASPTKQELEPAPIRCLKCGAANYGSAGFCCACGATRMPDGPPPAGTDPEQRPLTILFCDLASPTAHSGCLDPEDINEVTCAYHARIEDVVVSYGGVAVRFQSDGVLTHFGYPQADETDAERAVRAGLAVIEAVENLRGAHRFDFVARIGIATGLVIIGRRDTDGADVIGEAPTLARRLSAAAEPSAVVIASSTQALVKRLFEYRDLVLEFPGIADPVPALQVLGASNPESRFEALHQFDASSLVGREEELNLLLRRWDQARSGAGHVVLVTGEPGIGKSKLVLSMQEHVSCELTRLVYGCSPIHQASALYPIAAHLLRIAGIRSRDSAETKLSKLEEFAAILNEASPDTIALLAALLSIPVGNRYPLSTQTPERLRQLTLRLLLDQIRRHATRRPILMVFEDLQWADPTSLELLSLIIDGIPSLPVLLIITFRSEFQAPWTGQPHVTTLSLSRLGRSDSARIIAGVARGKGLPEPAVERILERTDGVPLFIEELTSTLLESGILRETKDSYVLDAPLPLVAIPMTLRASLIARLDRLAGVKEVAQIGAAIGREFSYELIRAVAPLTTMDLEAALGRSIASGLISCRGTPPEATYVFKHALIQDAAYSSLVRSRKQHLHRVIAQTIQERFSEIVATEPETVAHHCAAGGIFETASDYWVKAGDNCLSRFAYLEATKHLEQAVTSLKTLIQTPKTMERELEILLKMVSPLIAIRGPGSREVETLYLRALALIDELGDAAQRYPVLWGLWFAHFIRGEYAVAQEAGATLLEAAQTSGDEGQILEAHHALWALLSVRGNTLEAIEHMRRGRELYDRKIHASQALLYAGHDPGVCCRYHLAKDLWVTGRLEHSLHALDEALQLADQLKHPITTATALLYAVWVHYQRRDRPAMREVLSRLVSLTTEHSIVRTGEMARVMQLVDGCSDRLTLIQLHAKFIAARSAAQGTNWHREFCIFMMAERCLELGYPEDGITFLASISTEEVEGFYGPEIYRLEGELRLQLPNRDSPAIERCFHAALFRARQGSAKSLELRAATSLARYLREDGKPSDALNILMQIYEWFSEGDDLQDVKNARDLINDIQTST